MLFLKRKSNVKNKPSQLQNPKSKSLFPVPNTLLMQNKNTHRVN